MTTRITQDPSTHPNRTWPFLALVLLACAALALPTLAQPPWAGPPTDDPRAGFGPDGGPHPGAMGHRFMLPRIARFLDLSDAQIEQARALLEELAAGTRTLREEGQTLRTELDGLLNGDDPDPAAVGVRVIRIHELRDQGRAFWEDFEADFEALLTSEQLERWDLLKDLRMLHRGPGRGRGR